MSERLSPDDAHRHLGEVGIMLRSWYRMRDSLDPTVQSLRRQDMPAAQQLIRFLIDHTEPESAVQLTIGNTPVPAYRVQREPYDMDHLEACDDQFEPEDRLQLTGYEYFNQITNSSRFPTSLYVGEFYLINITDMARTLAESGQLDVVQRARVSTPSLSE